MVGPKRMSLSGIGRQVDRMITFHHWNYSVHCTVKIAHHVATLFHCVYMYVVKKPYSVPLYCCSKLLKSDEIVQLKSLIVSFSRYHRLYTLAYARTLLLTHYTSNSHMCALSQCTVFLLLHPTAWISNVRKRSFLCHSFKEPWEKSIRILLFLLFAQCMTTHLTICENRFFSSNVHT